MTFSLLARDPSTGQLGVAAQSHYLGVGATVTWAEAGVGVVATQACAARSYGPRGLALLRAGGSASDALSRLLDEDTHREIRQVGFLDAAGTIATHSGTRCIGAAGVEVGDHAVALGNMLDNDDVLPALLRGFEDADGDFAHRLVTGLAGAQDAGGDIRGSQSAALLVVDGRRTDEPWDGLIRDLRVEDHPEPVGELSRLVRLDDAFHRVSGVVFDPRGAVFGDPGSETDFAAAAESLADAAGVLDPNPEAMFWSAVVQARWGRTDAARHLLAEASMRNARLPRFLRYLSDAGILTPSAVAMMRGTGGAR